VTFYASLLLSWAAPFGDDLPLLVPACYLVWLSVISRVEVAVEKGIFHEFALLIFNAFDKEDPTYADVPFSIDTLPSWCVVVSRAILTHFAS